MPAETARAPGLRQMLYSFFASDDGESSFAFPPITASRPCSSAPACLVTHRHSNLRCRGWAFGVGTLPFARRSPSRRHFDPRAPLRVWTQTKWVCPSRNHSRRSFDHYTRAIPFLQACQSSLWFTIPNVGALGQTFRRSLRYHPQLPRPGATGKWSR